MMAKFYIPEVRKVNDIAARERKILGISIESSKQPIDVGFSAEDIKNGGISTNALKKPEIPDNPNDVGMYNTIRKREMKPRMPKDKP